MCQRYYQQIVGDNDVIIFGSGRGNGTAQVEISVPLAVPLRASPTMSSFTYATFNTSGTGANTTATPSVRKFLAEYMILCLSCTASGITNGQTACLTSSSGSTLVIDSEL